MRSKAKILIPALACPFSRNRISNIWMFSNFVDDSTVEEVAAVSSVASDRLALLDAIIWGYMLPRIIRSHGA